MKETALMPERRRGSQQRSGPEAAVDAGVLALAALAAFWPAMRNGFVNWDDPVVLVGNPHLGTSSAVRWAFSTTLIGHYQPLAWLVWSAVTSHFGRSPAAFHSVSLAVHVANGILVYGLTLQLGDFTRLGPVQGRGAAVLAGLLFLLHPTSVETVAWASAFPYVLSLFALLLSFRTYVSGHVGLSCALYAASLLARPAALGYPLILLIADRYPLNRQRRTSLRRLVVEKAPFAALAAAAAAVEWHARDVASVQEVGLVARAAMAATAPFVYVWRTLCPIRLSPLHPLPLAPSSDLVPLAIGIAAVIATSALAWSVRQRWPLVGTAWVVYVTLLAPVAGLAPSGLQATADRYMYLPTVVAAIVVGLTIARLLTERVLGIAVAATATAAVATLAVLTWHQTQYWKNSMTLWTRTAELDPRNDIATYNLAIAFADAGREDEAIHWYERTLVLVPDHDLARRNLALLHAAGTERNADRLAAAGDASAAINEYARVLALDANRAHAHAARGMLMMKQGQVGEAAVELRLAIDGGVKEAEVANALAFALTQTGAAAQAVSVLARAVTDHPDNVNVKHNLARLLATANDPGVRDGPRALQLALDVCDRTGNRDPRALDTLAAAYAAVDRPELARATAARAGARARELGDASTAAEIAAHARRYRW
jgi:protein O-mannosyl-transferase